MFGKSSGGYGAITHSLRHSDIWSTAACHSGDIGFELCDLLDMPAILRALVGAENSIVPSQRSGTRRTVDKKPVATKATIVGADGVVHKTRTEAENVMKTEKVCTTE